MSKITVAVCGLGSRGTVYSQILSRMSDKAEIVACADIDAAKLARYGETYHIPEEMRFSTGEEMLAQDRLADIMVIATWDRCHAEQAKAALKKGYHLLLEKPISPVLSECLEIEKLAHDLNREVIVCHVLRYTPFYGGLKKVIDSGEIGDVVSVAAAERVGYWHQAHSFVRGNWRNSELSSPMILQKSCHDMDILLWLTGKHCLSVSSIGSLVHFNEKNAPAGAAKRCMDGCPYYKTCPYSVYNCYIKRAEEEGYFEWPTDVVTQIPTLEALNEALKTGPYGRCVYACDNNVVDHQMVNLLCEDEVTVSFTMCAFTSHGGRSIHVMGTKGDIVGEMGENKLTVTVFGQEPHVVDTTLAADAFGHGGGDDGLVKDLMEFFTAAEGERSPSRTGISASVESHVVALAAEASRRENGRVVDIAEFKKQAEK